MMITQYCDRGHRVLFYRVVNDNTSLKILMRKQSEKGMPNDLNIWRDLRLQSTFHLTERVQENRLNSKSVGGEQTR